MRRARTTLVVLVAAAAIAAGTAGAQTAASGSPQTGNPGTDGMGNLLQSQLEQANVNAVTEMSDLITAQRAYSMNAKVVTAADEMLQQTANMMR